MRLQQRREECGYNDNAQQRQWLLLGMGGLSSIGFLLFKIQYKVGEKLGHWDTMWCWISNCFFFFFQNQQRAFLKILKDNIIQLNFHNSVRFGLKWGTYEDLKANFQAHLGLKHNFPIFIYYAMMRKGSPKWCGKQVSLDNALSYIILQLFPVSRDSHPFN